MTDRKHGLKTDSEAYKLVDQALDIAVSSSESEAIQFLSEQVTELGLKYWECIAINRCYVKSLADEKEKHQEAIQQEISERKVYA